MSSENIAVLRSGFEAYSRGEEFAEMFDPDVVWNPADEAPMQGVDAVRSYMERWESEWERLDTVPEEFTDADDKVIVTVHFSGRGRTSGIEVDARLFEVYTLRDGKVTRMDEYTDRSDALEAAGLGE
ncbi:MAG: nuclear transport factor 2 family protein [Thermoleophilaceae bacterium]